MSLRFFLLSFFYAAFLSGMFSSCEIINPKEAIPSYIHIDKIDLATTTEQGSNSHKITDAWVYVEDQLIGAFELPATIPLLWGGTHTVTIKPGIKVNGIAALRSIYPFYEPYVAKINLIPDSVITINPTITYNSYTVFEWKEAFEDGGISLEKTATSDTTIDKTSNPAEVFEGSYSGIVNMDANHDFFQCNTVSPFVLPIGDHPVFLEMDYKTNEEIKVGLYAYSGTQIQILDVMYINKSDIWKKIYINLNSTINSADSPDNFKVFFEVSKSSDVATPLILFDNIKLVHN